MNQLKIQKAFAKLGEELSRLPEEWNDVISMASHKNGWFTPDNSRYALKHWSEILTVNNLVKLAPKNHLQKSPKNIGIVMAGNIPLVGFHDFVCVLLSGNKAVIKLSSDDEILIQHLLKKLQTILPGIDEFWEIKERLNDIDAVIATGSNNTSRYFEYYFRNIPHLIRKNRTSVAVIQHKISDNDLKLLGEDVFRYFGLGCRNVGKLFLPTGFDLTRILDHLMPYSFVLDHHKYANNYTYHRAIYLLNQTPHLDTGFLLLKEDEAVNSPLGALFYSFYNSQEALQKSIKEKESNIQCVIGNVDLCQGVVPFGFSQKPKLTDFADHINTFTFLQNLK
jgi:hypothetical protein